MRHKPCDVLKVCLKTQACKNLPCYSHKILKADKKRNFPYGESKVEGKQFLGDLFDGDLYLLCVISIFRLLKLGFISDPDQYRKNLAIIFHKFYICTCVIEF